MPEPSWKTTTRTIALSIVLGGAAGVLTTALTTNYLNSYALELGELTAPLRLAEERPRTFPQSYEEALEEVLEKVSPGLVEFYAPATSPSDAYLSAEAIMHGAMLTSDGWILTFPSPGLNPVGLVVVIGGERHDVLEVVPDTVTGASFVKIEADNLPVLAFGSGLDLTSGERVFTVPMREALVASTVIGNDWGTEEIWSSDRPVRRILLAHPLGGTLGFPVANLSGELVGIVESNVDGVRVLPLESVLPSFTSLLREGEIQRASLGINSIDLSRSVGLSEELTQGRHAGALIFDEKSIEPDGPAAESELEVGDIILSVDGKVINGKRSLDEYVMSYKPGDQLRLLVDRGGEDVEVMVTLDVL